MRPAMMMLIAYQIIVDLPQTMPAQDISVYVVPKTKHTHLVLNTIALVSGLDLTVPMISSVWQVIIVWATNALHQDLQMGQSVRTMWIVNLGYAEK